MKNSMNELVDEEAIKANENVVGIFSKEGEHVESFDMDQSTDERKPNENMWSDVADLMRNDKSITKITGKRMRQTMTKFYK
jgi:histidinol phosphatase-like enzyme